jgi:hypothetical protein
LLDHGSKGFAVHLRSESDCAHFSPSRQRNEECRTRASRQKQKAIRARPKNVNHWRPYKGKEQIAGRNPSQTQPNAEPWERSFEPFREPLESSYLKSEICSRFPFSEIPTLRSGCLDVDTAYRISRKVRQQYVHLDAPKRACQCLFSVRRMDR